jgi:phospholipid/cholesterol/gamma-HCH transport system permease protein
MALETQHDRFAEVAGGTDPALAPLELLEAIGRFTHFAITVVLALPHALRRPAELALQMHRVGLGSLPLVAAAGISIGVVAWMHAHHLLADIGTEAQLPAVVGAFVVVGLGPVITALVVAGQVGAGIGAELGSMRITEQMDALEAMGVSPLHRLASTRVLALILIMPLLTVLLDALALGASFAAESLGGVISAREYFQRSLEYLPLDRSLAATLNSLAFGFCVGVTGCWLGFRARGGTEGVGRAATRSVVVSMFLVLLANVVLVRLAELIL